MSKRKENSIRLDGQIAGKNRQFSLPLSPLIILGVAILAAFIANAGVAGAAQSGQQLSLYSSDVPQTHKKAMWGPPSIEGVSQFPVYRKLGVGIYQMQIHWNDIAPTKPSDPTNPDDPSYLWPETIRDTITEAESYGMKVMIMPIGTPPWANGGMSDGLWAPKNPSDYADFVTAASRKYASVRMWMIWGEPNRSPNFKPLVLPSRGGPLTKEQSQAPRFYGRMLNAAYGALKRESSKNLVIGGNTYTAAGRDSISTYQWIRYMRLPSGHMPRMDLYGHNPFCFRVPNLKNRPSPKGRVDFSDLGRLAKKLDKYYPSKRLKLFLSEWGVPAGGKDAELGFSLTYRKQANWIRAAFKVQRKLRRIYTLGWVHPYDRPDFGTTTGLLKSNGDLKPGYSAFRAG